MWKWKIFGNGKSKICMDDSVNTCDKVIKSHEEEVKTILANFNEKNKTCKTQCFYFYLPFY